MSISYLLLWTTCTAAALTVIPRIGVIIQLKGVLDVTLLVTVSALFGWLLSGTLLVLWHAARRTLWPLEPGEWLVMGAASVLVFLTGEQVTYRLLAWLNWRDPFAVLGIRSVSIETLWLAAMGMVYLAGAFAQRRHMWWAAALWGLALGTLPLMMPVAMYPFVWTPPWAVYLGAALLFLGLTAIAVISDRRRREPRHWLHWSGVLILWLTCGYAATIMTLRGLGIVHSLGY